MVESLSFFLFQPVFYNWCNKDHGMYYPVCRMVHIKEPLLIIGKSSPCSGGSGFPLLLFEWSFIICLLNSHKIKCAERGNPLLHYMSYSFLLAARVLLYAPSHRQDSTYHSLCYTSRTTGTRNSAIGSPFGIDPTTHPTMNEPPATYSNFFLYFFFFLIP